MNNRQPSATKSGPGRVHKQGHKSSPGKRKGTGPWHGQHFNPERATRRNAIKASGGIRQFKRQTRMSATLI